MVARESAGWLERMYEKLPPEATLLSMPDGGWDCELSTFPLPNASYTISSMVVWIIEHSELHHVPCRSAANCFLSLFGESRLSQTPLVTAWTPGHFDAGRYRAISQ